MRHKRRVQNRVTYLVVLILGVVVGVALWSTIVRVRTLPPPGYKTVFTVQVLNGCGEDGLARRVASILRKAGYDVSHTGRADSYHYKQDIVILRDGTRQEARLLAETLGGDVSIIVQRADNTPYNATVIVGRPHFLAPIENP